MARDFSKKFTDSYIHGIKPTDKEQLFSDRDNLYLLVKSTGAKIWRFIYTHPITKKRIKKSFGNHPSIPFAFARDKARIWCGLLAQGDQLPRQITSFLSKNIVKTAYYQLFCCRFCCLSLVAFILNFFKFRPHFILLTAPKALDVIVVAVN